MRVCLKLYLFKEFIYNFYCLLGCPVESSVLTELFTKQASGLPLMSNNFTHPRLILDGKWRTTDGDPAGPYFQKPLKLAVNC